jgi:16S rRNA (cytosine1402-N4)-methyltransferase
MTKIMSNYHTSVFLKEAVSELKVTVGKKYIDGTLGGGGHTSRILEAGGDVLGLDVDEEALAYVERKWRMENGKWKVQGKCKLVRGNFRDIDILARQNGFERVDGILLDLGVSSHQFDTAERGFSLQATGPLDMRMDQTLHVTAKDLVNGLTRDELTDLFTQLGEERFSRKIAQAIVDARKRKPIESTAELEEIVFRNVPRIRSFEGSKNKSAHPATRVFQALRIAVNDELHSLEEVLPKAIGLLHPGGRLVVITFHSLEDRIVKHTFLAFTEKGLGTVVTKKPILPTEEEITANPRSRSAKMRVFEKKL